MKLTINDSKDGQFFVSLIAKNGRILLTSETYKAKAKAKRLADGLGSNFGVPVIDLTKKKSVKKK